MTTATPPNDERPARFEDHEASASRSEVTGLCALVLACTVYATTMVGLACLMAECQRLIPNAKGPRSRTGSRRRPSDTERRRDLRPSPPTRTQAELTKEPSRPCRSRPGCDSGSLGLFEQGRGYVPTCPPCGSIRAGAGSHTEIGSWRSALSAYDPSIVAGPAAPPLRLVWLPASRTAPT